MKRLLTISLMLTLILGLVGCKPYNKPEYIQAAPNETAYVIPLEGDTLAQGKLNSAEAYDKCKVMTKRILITKRWNQTGRQGWIGEWIPTITVIGVDRSPVTREWTPELTTGSSAKNQAIWAESKDSIGFSMPITCTACIKEEDTSKFLYRYPNNQLANIMDSQVRNKIQEYLSLCAARENLDKLRTLKEQFMKEVSSNTVAFFKDEGITITSIGMGGGMTYEAKGIQESIDAVFVAQQEKEVEKARLEALATKEERMKKDGVAAANQAREIARGEKDAAELKAEGQAAAIEKVVAALGKASSCPEFLELKKLEVETSKIQKWDGSVPQWMTGGDNSFVPMISMTDIPKQKNVTGTTLSTPVTASK